MSNESAVLDWNPCWNPCFDNSESKPSKPKFEMVEEVVKRSKKKTMVKTVITVGVITVTLFTSIFIPHDIVLAVEGAVEASAETGTAWDKLVHSLVKLLDPVAKVFGVIAAIAIMTGNGKIGLERLFWLSIGYLTSRKIEAWIEFLNSL